MKRLRVILAVLFVIDFLAYVPNFPEMGIETRGNEAGPALMAMYTFAIFAPLAGAIIVWFLPRFAGWLAMLLGALNIVPSALDIARVLFPQPPPTLIAIDEAVLIVIGVVLIWIGAATAKQR